MRILIFSFCLFLFVSCKHDVQKVDKLNLNTKLSGNWIATAFDGELHESWSLGDDGWMLQEGYYIEDNDTSYSANSRIEEVNNKLILFSVIKNSMPKIFQATENTNEKIVFENKDYRNPFEVIYEFKDSNNYRRTIKGLESDSLVTYIFEFIKQK